MTDADAFVVGAGGVVAVFILHSVGEGLAEVLRGDTRLLQFVRIMSGYTALVAYIIFVSIVWR